MIMRMIENFMYNRYTHNGEKEIARGQYRDATLVYVKELYPRSIAGQSIGKYIFLDVDYDVENPKLICHEYIHFLQWKKYGAILFVLKYFIEMAWKFLTEGTYNDAYYEHSMEQQARDMTDGLDHDCSTVTVDDI